MSKRARGARGGVETLRGDYILKMAVTSDDTTDGAGYGYKYDQVIPTPISRVDGGYEVYAIKMIEGFVTRHVFYGDDYGKYHIAFYTRMNGGPVTPSESFAEDVIWSKCGYIGQQDIVTMNPNSAGDPSFSVTFPEPGPVIVVPFMYYAWQIVDAHITQSYYAGARIWYKKIWINQAEYMALNSTQTDI